MNNLLAPAVGGILIVLGATMMLSHLRTWKRRRGSDDLSHQDLSHYRSQFRRRMQASGMIALLGLLIAVGDVLPLLQKNPVLATVYWLGVLILTAWVVLLGLSDALSTRLHARSALRDLQQQQRTLQRELARLRRHTNGKDERSDHGSTMTDQANQG